MKKTIVLIAFILVTFNFLSVMAQPQKESSGSARLSSYNNNESDSLLFDGNFGNSNYINNVNDECNLIVTNVRGKVFGSIITLEISNLCGEIDTFPKMTYGQLKVGDIVASEQFLRTGDNSQVKVELKDGKEVWLAPNTEFKMGREYCMGKGVAELLTGRVHVNGGNGDGNSYISTEHSIVHITHTEFSVEIVKAGDITTDIIRVYKGSVSFGLNMQNKDLEKKNDDKAAEMKKIADDFQNGKIGMEEFSKKMTEFQSDMSKSSPIGSVTVNAEYESRIVGTVNPTDPVSFDTKENRWWENF